TFTEFAEISTSVETRERNYGKARKAYDAVLRFRPNVRMDAEQEATLDSKLAIVRERLIAVGQKLEPLTSGDTPSGGKRRRSVPRAGGGGEHHRLMSGPTTMDPDLMIGAVRGSAKIVTEEWPSG